MAKIKASIVLVLLITLFFSCKESKPINQMRWIEGTWATHPGLSGYYEQWMRKGDSSFIGKGFLLNEGDTVFSERLKIVQRGNDLFYVATVSDQNKARSVDFKLTEVKDREFTFANEQHDFPTHIIYKYIAPDSLYTRIQGKRKGKFEKQDFFMKRIE